MANRFALLTPPDIIGSFQRGQARATQRERERLADQELRATQDRGNQLRQLAPQEYSARTPEQQQAYLSQVAAVNPQAATAAQERFAATEERKQALRSNTAKTLMSVPAEARPALYQQMIPTLRQAGIEAPDEYTAQMDTAMQAYATQGQPAAQSRVQSTVIGKDGQYYTVDASSGKFTPSGVYAAPGVRVMEQEGTTPYGVVTSRGQPGQVVSLGAPQGAPQQPGPAQPGMQTPQGATQGQPLPTGAGGPVRTPTAAERARGIAQAEADVKMQTAPDIARETTLATEGAKALTERQTAMPGQLADIQKMRENIEGLLDAPGFSTIYGKSRYISPSMLPGGEGADADVRREQLDAQAFQEAIQKMRGLGALSNAEGQKVSAAYTRATNAKQSEESARQAWNEVLQTLTLAEDRVRRGGTPQAQPRAAPAQAATQQATRNLNGKTYVQIDGQWYEQE